MSGQRIGKVVFWVGVLYVVGFNWIFSWIATPLSRHNTPEMLSGTIWAVDGPLFYFWYTAGPIGVAIALIGILIYSQKKQRFTWLYGLGAFLLAFFVLGPFKLSQHYPPLFGIAGGIIAISFLGILWAWSRTHARLEGSARIGAYFEVIGYFFLVIAAYFLCGYTSGPHLKAFGNQPVNTAESMLVTLTIGWLLLFIGYYMMARAKK